MQAPVIPIQRLTSRAECDFNLIEETKMKRRLIFVAALAVLVTLPVLAQRGQEHGQERGQNPPRANQGHVPPPPPRREDAHAKPEPEHHATGHMNTTPHVNKDHWYGHDRPDDKRYHFDHPFDMAGLNILARRTAIASNASIPIITASGFLAASTLK